MSLIELYAYLECRDDGASKNYLIFKDSQETYYGAWGRINGGTRGTRKFNSQTETDKVIKAKQRKGYVSLSEMNMQKILDYHYDRYSKVVLNQLNWTATEASDFSRDYRHQANNAKAVDKGGNLTILKRLREYIVDVNPDDRKANMLAQKISKCETQEDVTAILISDKMLQYFGNDIFYKRVMFINMQLGIGVNPIKDFLRKLNPHIIKQSNLNKDDVNMLRDSWNNKRYSMAQLWYLFSLFNRIEKSNYTIKDQLGINPFE